MYQLQDSLYAVKGVGVKLRDNFQRLGLSSILDLLLFLPLRYEDRSEILTLRQLQNLGNSYLLDQPRAASNKKPGDQKSAQSSPKVRPHLYTVKAKLLNFSQYYKGRLLIGRAVISDGTADLPCIWFNNRFLKNKLRIGKEYFFSGAWQRQTLQQPSVEEIKEQTIHTGRLVPLYSQTLDLKQGSLRRLIQEIAQNLRHSEDELSRYWQQQSGAETFSWDRALLSLHFPQDQQQIVSAREFLAFVEMYYLIQQAKITKEQWQHNRQAVTIPDSDHNYKLPFNLTSAQQRALKEIKKDLNSKVPMNRLLIGDVGSGKTIVAALAAATVLEQGHNVALLAPTKILAQQHLQTLERFLPQINLVPVLGGAKQAFAPSKQASLYLGTHALLNHLNNIQPALVIYDEQQRFGVKQRQLDNYLTAPAKKSARQKTSTLKTTTGKATPAKSSSQKTTPHPHLLSMTATPIPRTLMLSIFTHLDSSYLDEMPQGRQMATTWLINQAKEEAALNWLAKELLSTTSSGSPQALVVCPFIDPSDQASLANVAAVKDVYQQLNSKLTKIYQAMAIPAAKRPRLGLLHSRLSSTEQQDVIGKLFDRQIQLLVSTAMIEVGVDLPNADIMLIYGAERFGLASLHQLRGRVGRQGQASFCLLFPSPESKDGPAEQQQEQIQRLQQFCQEKDGFKLAQLDLERRGAGNIFGLQQSGFQQLRFASWTNNELLGQAQKAAAQFNNQAEQGILAGYLAKFQTQSQTVANN